MKKEIIKLGLSVYGIVLFFISILFWIFYGNKHELLKFIPPITSIVIFVTVIIMWIIVNNKDTYKKLFGTESEAKKILFDILSSIFIGFILLITILWGLVGGAISLHTNIPYLQSFLLVLLFFYLVYAFYILLTEA